MSLRVLLIEEGAAAEGLALRLIDRGCRVSLARSARQAAEFIDPAQESFDLVLADIGTGLPFPAARPPHAGMRVALSVGGVPGLELAHGAWGPKELLEAAARMGAGRDELEVFIDERVDPDGHFARLLDAAGHNVRRGAAAPREKVDLAFLHAGLSGWKLWEELKAAGTKAVMPAGPCGQHVADCAARGEVPLVGKPLGPADLDGLVDRCLKAARRAGASVLIVDDDAAFREWVSDFLSGEGHSVDQASTAKRGLERAAAREYDVIISDYYLPDLTGIQMVERMREQDVRSSVIFLTAAADLDSALQAVHLRADGYLNKPVAPEALLEALSRALQGRRLERQVKGLLRELSDANARLESFNRMKSRFLFLVAHDIRSPLAGAKGYADYLLLKNGQMPEVVKEGLSLISHAVVQVDRLVEDLMDLGRMESGKLAVRPGPVDLRRLIKMLRARFEVLAREAEVSVAFDDAAAPAEIVADPLRLDQVLSNLVGNAFKHAGAGRRVTVTFAAGEDGGLAVDVADDGAGLASEQIGHIFEPYYQGDDPQALKKGMGLGLAIVRELVEAHGGRVWAESPGPGKGSTFRLRLPPRPPERREAPAEARRDGTPPEAARGMPS